MLTSTQHRMLVFINEEISRTGICPSLREMADGLGYASHNSVVWLIRCLERRGFIRRIPASPRAIEVLRLPHEAAVRRAA